jgi:hypothetical protein
MAVESTHNTNDGENIMPVGRVKYFAEIDHEYICGVHFSGGDTLILALILSCKWLASSVNEASLLKLGLKASLVSIQFKN